MFLDPPENLTITSRAISVAEKHKPDEVVCSGKGNPSLDYVWTKNNTNEVVSNKDTLSLGPVLRTDSGSYICKASNRHGSSSIAMYLNVQCKYA